MGRYRPDGFCGESIIGPSIGDLMGFGRVVECADSFSAVVRVSGRRYAFGKRGPTTINTSATESGLRYVSRTRGGERTGP